MSDSELDVLFGRCFSDAFADAVGEQSAWAETALAEDPENPLARFVAARCAMLSGDADRGTAGYLAVLDKGIVPPAIAGLIADDIAAHGDDRTALDVVDRHCLAKGFVVPGHDLFEAAFLRRGMGGQLVAMYNDAYAADRFPGPGNRRMKENALARGLPFVFLNTLPKSGSIFLYFNMASMLGVPRQRISLSLFPRDLIIERAVAFAARGGCITQEHLDASPENLDVLVRHGVRRIYLHVRDPRQAALSQFHDQETAGIRSTAARPKEYDGLSREQRIDWNARVFVPNCVTWIDEWIKADESDLPIDIRFGEYADFRRDNAGTVREILEFFGCAEAADWSRLKERSKGAMHFRKADPEEWRRAFSEDQKAAMWRAIPDAMAERFGWQE